MTCARIDLDGTMSLVDWDTTIASPVVRLPVWSPCRLGTSDRAGIIRERVFRRRPVVMGDGRETVAYIEEEEVED